jgi:uncharacterized protein involved in exopolysaccharide biosynthesis
MEISLFDLYEAVKKNIRRHLAIGFSISVLALIILFLLPDIYKSSANLFPNKKYFSGSAGLLGSLGTSITDKASSLLGGGSAETDKILVILNSESAKRHIIEKHNLMVHYEVADLDFPYTRARKQLESNTEFNVFPEGNVLIDVFDEDRQMAYDMANSYVVYLDSAMKAIDSNEARQNREFLESRLRKNEAEIDSIQTEFQKFQRETGIYELEEQLVANFSVVGETIRTTMESEFGVILQKNLAKPNSQIYSDLTDRLKVFDNSRKQMLERIGKEYPSLILDYEKLPEYGKTFFDLKAALTIQIEIQKVLVPLYEQSVMEEQKSMTTISLVDRPEIAEKKAAPKRLLLILVIIFITGIAQILSQYFILAVNLTKDA